MSSYLAALITAVAFSTGGSLAAHSHTTVIVDHGPHVHERVYESHPWHHHDHVYIHEGNYYPNYYAGYPYYYYVPQYYYESQPAVSVNLQL